MSLAIKELEGVYDDTPEEMVCFRWLREDEYYKLECVFNEYNDKIPSPKLSRVAIAELESTGEIIGFFAVQLKHHAEPMWIHPDHRKGGLWLKLAMMVEPIAAKGDSYIVATRPEVVAMCEKLQLKKIEHPVYVREFVGESQE